MRRPRRRARGRRCTSRCVPWTGYVDARRYALGRVTTPYAFMLDADELLSDDLRAALGGDLSRADGFRVRRITMLAGRAVRAAGWSAERLVRCFRVDRAQVVANSVGGSADLHERWVVDGAVADLPGMIVHDSYPSVASYRERFARYTKIEAGGAARLAACVRRRRWPSCRCASSGGGRATAPGATAGAARSSRGTRPSIRWRCNGAL